MIWNLLLINFKPPIASTSQIVFVDTPGFDDTNISDFNILQAIVDWLKLT